MNLLFTVLLLVATAVGSYNSRIPIDEIQSGIASTITFSPRPVRIGGSTTFIYELHISNLTDHNLRLDEISIQDSVGKLIRKINGELLLKVFQNKQKGINKIPTVILSAHDTGVVYIELSEPSGTRLKSIYHETVATDVTSGENTISKAVASIVSETPIILGPPLGEGNWAAIHSPEWERGHRRVFYNKNGLDRIPGRFAIDFIKLTEGGLYANGDENQIINWSGYATNVLAVADGTISNVRNDFPESEKLSEHPGYDPDKAAGNYISLKIDDTHFVFYEHLKPGSVLVMKGQTVRKGDVIAKLGFTGQSTGPHLHLHVADKDSPLGAEGLPYVFESFKMLGDYPDFNIFGKGVWTKRGNTSGPTIHEYPEFNSVIRFQ